MTKRRISAKNEQVYPLMALRTVALHAQGLATTPGSEPATTPEAIYRVIDQIGCLQIDTLHLVQRSQYLALWSRLGTYDPALLDRVAFGDPALPLNQRDRRLFEYWLKAACLIPLTEFRYRLPLMRAHREGVRLGWVSWLQREDNQALVQNVRARITAEGGLRTSDFEQKAGRRNGWWDWKPAKIALEYLYNTGEVMIADRVKFQRVYDLRERVLPSWVDTSEPTPEETDRHLLLKAVKALGVSKPLPAADYFRVKRTPAKPLLAKLIKSGELLEVKGTLITGEEATLLVHPDHRELLDQAADGALKAERTTFLSPFDNLFWATNRDMEFWAFKQHIEAYTPAAKRVYGYFCLPIVHKDRLIGRFDPKLERKTGVLRLKALHLEPGIALDDAMIADVAGALRDFMKFHSAKTLDIEQSNPQAFGQKVLQALKS